MSPDPRVIIHFARIIAEIRKQIKIDELDPWLTNPNVAYNGIIWGWMSKLAHNIASNQVFRAGRDDYIMANASSSGLTRRALLSAFAATAVVATPTYSNAAGFLRGAGDIRRVKLYSGRTGERIDMIYWIEGQYIRDALKEVNNFMRDWRTGGVKSIDLRTVDIIAATHRMLDSDEPYMLLSGYRSPKTNAMLRSRSGNVAKKSLHMEGKAADLRLASRSVSQMARAAMAVRSGGVGKYSRSNFVHMDCGVVRSWGA